MKHYQVSGFLEIDPTVRAGMRRTGLILWPEPNYDYAPRLWSDAHDFGLTVGVAHSSWEAHGVFGLLHADALTRAEINHLELPTLGWQIYRTR